MVGKTLAHYQVVEKIGAGGMGEVYRARDTRLGRTVALKLIGQHLSADEEARTRLLHEARTASSLNHPHICTIYEVGEADGQTYIGMEYVEGRPLNALVPHSGLPLENTLHYGRQIADALGHAHERGIVHRDLKTANVAVTPEGRAKVLDFGLAQHLGKKALTEATRSQDSLSDRGAIAGTLQYMAPEVLRGEPAEAGADLWALGVVLYEMATGDLPFKGRSGFELSSAILSEPPAPFPPRVPPGLRAVIQRCLTKEPGQRYRSAREVQAALEALQSDTAVVVSAARPAPRRGLWALGAVLVVAAVLIGGLSLYKQLQKPASPLGVTGSGKLRLLFSTAGQVFDPDLSPDGKMIVYAADEEGQPDLFVSRVAGGARVRLTNDKVLEADPQFSPDGEQIAFSCRHPETAVPSVCLIPALGGQVVPILPGALAPAWSPDGSRLAFVRAEPGRVYALGTAALDGTDVRILLEGDARLPFFRDAAWSPDGSQLAVVRSRGGVSGELWLVPLDGGKPRHLSSDPPDVFSHSPVFTPDGRGIIHSSNRGGATNLWILPIDGGAPVRLTSGPGPDQSASLARDGSIAFVSSRARLALVTLNLKTHQTREVATHSSFIWAPAFSPDGREIAFSRAEADGSWHIWIVPTESGTPRQLTGSEQGEIYPRFTPDGTALIFTTWGQPRRIGLVPRAGGPVRFLSPPEKNEGYGDISPDGRWIAFVRAEQETPRIYVAPFEGGPARLLVDSPSTLPRWSPDGQWIAFSPDRSYSGGIFVVRADGTGKRRLTERGGWPVWWPEGKQIGYLDVGADGTQRIRVISLDGGSPRTLSGIRFVGTNYPFDVSPDGRLLVTSNDVHFSGEIWLLQPEPRETSP